MSGIRDFRPSVAELRRLVSLALPVAVVQMGLVSQGLSTPPWLAGSPKPSLPRSPWGTSTSSGVAVFGMGLLLALDPLVSQAYGAGDHDEIRTSVQRGLVLSVLLTSSPRCPSHSPNRCSRSSGSRNRSCRSPPIRPSADRRNVALLRLRGVPAGTSGARKGCAHRLDDRAREFAERLRQPGPGLRQPGRSGDGSVGSGWATSISRWFMCLAVLILGLRLLAPYLRGAGREVLRIAALCASPGWGCPSGCSSF